MVTRSCAGASATPTAGTTRCPPGVTFVSSRSAN